jgi:hypothetical protein
MVTLGRWLVNADIFFSFFFLFSFFLKPYWLGLATFEENI